MGLEVLPFQLAGNPEPLVISLVGKGIIRGGVGRIQSQVPAAGPEMLVKTRAEIDNARDHHCVPGFLLC